MSNVIRLHPTAPIRALPDDSLRADCERLMRKVRHDERIPTHLVLALADVFDAIIARTERM